MSLGTSIAYYGGGTKKKKTGKSYLSSVNTSNKWSDELDSIYYQISNREKFNYDQNNDALYKQYAQQYQQNAKLAMEDTVGQVSALTGGYANSYAATAGQAMYNQQMDGLNSKALEIYQLALQRYNMESDRLMGIYNMTATNYGLEQDRINSEVAQAQWNAEFDESQRQYDESMAFEYARAMAQDAQWAAELASDNSQFYASLAFDKSRAAASDAQYAKDLAYKYAAMEYDKQYNDARLAEEKRQYDTSLAEEQRQFNYKNGIGSKGSSSQSVSTQSVSDTEPAKKKVVTEQDEPIDRSNVQGPLIPGSTLDSDLANAKSNSGRAQALAIAYQEGSISDDELNAYKKKYGLR